MSGDPLLADDWSEPVEVEVAKPVGTVMSVRLTAEQAKQLRAEAQRRGTTASTLVRRAIEVWLGGTDQARRGVNHRLIADSMPQVSVECGSVVFASCNPSQRSFDALVGEVQRLRRALAQIAAADISCQTCLDIKAIAREALGGETDA